MVLSVIFYWLLLSIAAHITYILICLAQNYRAACKIGLPVVIIPVSPENPLWMLFGNRIVSAIKLLFGESHFTRFSLRGWVFYDKNRAAEEFGALFVFVHPDKIWLYVCDAEVLQDVLHENAEFPRPLELYSMLEVFGPNVATVDGTEWQRQRKITSSTFGEENNTAVWYESVRQAQELLEHWCIQPNPIYDTAKHVRTLSLHVLSNVGFGKNYSFHNASEPPKPGHIFNYRDSLVTVLDNILLILIVGPRVLCNRFMPRKWARVGQATVDFKAYIQDLHATEKDAMSSQTPRKTNMMTSLLEAMRTKNPAVKGLSEAEVFGNAFVYNFAGHDTTAITLGWTIYLLAAHPDVQEWIGEEIKVHLGTRNTSKIPYSEGFPKLKRCQAILLEVLRLYNPLPGMIKSTGSTPSTLMLAGKQITVPAGARIDLHTDAIHTLPQYWGDDALQWRPQRWILKPEDDDVGLEGETILTPKQGTYIPWSGGLRVCPGKKFGQVEFTAVLATLFHRHRVDPCQKADESIDSARARVMAAVNDSGVILLLQMLHPERVGLNWREV